MLEEKRRSSSVAQKGKGIAKWCTVRRTRKYSQRGSKRKGCQENIQNFKKSMARYWDRESRYA